MLPKPERLTKEDFMGVRPKVFFRCDLLDIAILSSQTQKFACVISKKTLKRAVDRNQVKRRIFEILHDSKPKKIASFVVYPKKPALNSPYEEIYKEIKKGFATLQ
jgi:ribonuclease P protein component